MPTIQERTARTTLRDAEAAAENLCQQLGAGTPKLVTIFADRSHDHRGLNAALRKRLPGARLVGASSAGEIDSEGLHEGSIVLAALYGDFEVGLGIGTGLSQDPVVAGATAVRKACEELGVHPNNLGSRHVGMVIDDGFKYKKEELLIGMTEPNPALVLVGGGAADREPDPQKQSALLHIDGQVVDDAVLIALFQTEARWAAMRSHWYQPTGQTLTITKVDGTCTRALEIDGQPAAKRYAELLGVGVDDLEFGKPDGFAKTPTALRVGREYFMRAPWKPLDDGSVLFANLLEEGTELELMKIGDVAGSTRRFFTEEIPHRVGPPSAIFAFHCSGRMWYAHATGQTEAISKAMQGVPRLAGMNVQFELYCGFHINTTITALAFGSSG